MLTRALTIRDPPRIPPLWSSVHGPLSAILTCISLLSSGIVFGIAQALPQLKDSMKFKDCLWYGSIMSATDPGISLYR